MVVKKKQGEGGLPRKILIWVGHNKMLLEVKNFKKYILNPPIPTIKHRRAKNFRKTTFFLLRTKWMIPNHNWKFL